MTETSKEYAAALFELARETASEEEFGRALAFIRSVFAEDPEYADLLSTPSIPISERKALIEQAFASRVPAYVLSLTELLCEKGHIREFGRCVSEYEALYKALEAVSTARVVSAVPLSEDEREALVGRLQKLSGHMVDAEYEIDKSIIGGVIIYMDDKVIDGSIKHKLKEVKEVIGK